MKSEELLGFFLDLQQECGGVIPFERYMQEALYHPLYGYYSAQIRDVGAAGDFSTSATLDLGLGMALAAWITKRAQELGWQRIPVIEVGAGNGKLARDILRHLPWKTRWHIDYMIHETSPMLQQKQRKLLRWSGVRWISDLAVALDQSQGRALIFSNELVDAFPCKLFQKTGQEWQELGITISKEGGLSEKIIATTSPDPWFAQFAHLSEGQRVERHDSYRDWLRTWSSHWREGALLTIDYGEKACDLYERKPEGSLRAYWRHQRLTRRDLYARFGKQDLTVDVNFTDLLKWGEELRWKNKPLITQHEFVEAWVSRKSIVKNFPTEAGKAFKVLEQSPV